MRRFLRYGMVVTLLSAACSGEPATREANVTMTLGKKSFTLEVAADPATREKGLMHRTSMAADHGMIFIFPKPDRYSFWMRNTRIPLDLLYLDADGKIVDLTTLKPMDETLYEPRADAKFVIEVNAGVVKNLGLKTGDKLALPEKLPVAKS